MGPLWYAFDVMLHWRRSRRGRGAGVRSPPKQKCAFWYRKHFYGCIWHYLWHRRLQSADFPSSVDSKTTYLRSIMKQDFLNNCKLMRCQKWITDINTVKIAKRFACANEQLRAFWVGVCVWLSGRLEEFFLWFYWLEPVSCRKFYNENTPFPSAQY